MVAISLSFFALSDLTPFSAQSRQTGSVRQPTVRRTSRPLARWPGRRRSGLASAASVCPPAECVKTFVRVCAPFSDDAAADGRRVKPANGPSIPRTQWVYALL